MFFLIIYLKQLWMHLKYRFYMCCLMYSWLLLCFTSWATGTTSNVLHTLNNYAIKLVGFFVVFFLSLLVVSKRNSNRDVFYYGHFVNHMNLIVSSSLMDTESKPVRRTRMQNELLLCSFFPLKHETESSSEDNKSVIDNRVGSQVHWLSVIGWAF